ncbi:MAG: ATPase [Deltaproteobacteria bacterium CG2_30_63_29]|nr:MAG: ATPase [Deltaproteobacteria bacterium CG2_30_63_29]PJB36703.1 MAG: ATPase [Deltaproteobacteria bacterium CG_4_9_14_3_um_filter_63_12]
MQDFKIANTSVQQIEDLIRARYPLMFVISSEESRVEESLQGICERRGRRFITWSCTEGFIGGDGDSFTDIRDPQRALEHIFRYENNALFTMRDFHPYLADPQIARRLRDLSKDFKIGKYRKHILLLSSVFKLPGELEKEFNVIDYELPNRDQVNDIVLQVLKSVPENLCHQVRTDSLYRERVVEAALGLTADEAENVFSKSLIRTKDFDIDTIIEEKKSIIRKSGILEFYQSNLQIKDVGGLEILKTWLSTRQLAFSSTAREFGLPLPKGILLLGIPGCGKSLTAKAVGAMWQMPLLRLDVGKVFSGLVGSSEENMRKAISTAEAVAPAILWLDELEKGFSGTRSSGQTDGGTSARVFASFITWLQEKTSPVFVIATANDVSMLPPELLRKGRFDEIFFVDLPHPGERRRIIEIHINAKKRDASKFDIDKIVAATQGFSGSEIEQAIVSALFDAFENKRDIDTESVVTSCTEIIPLSYQMKERIDYMRDWAKSRARKASVDDDDLEIEENQIRQLEM